MLKYLLLASSVAVVLGGRSPSAVYIDEIAVLGPRYSDNVLEDARLDVPGLVTKYGYPIESHDLVTEDGYGLTIHRIPHGRDQNNQPDSQKPVVFLMHGLLSSSAEFLVLGPGNALAYVLAEEGYDVWLGNARGSYYSRRHVSLNPDSDRDFWRFSWDEIGNLDLAASFDRIESVTGQRHLHYIGHSQGGTTFFVLNALRPEYADKFISFHGLAPAAFFTYNDHPCYQVLAANINVLEPLAFAVLRGELLPNREWLTQFSSRFCYQGSVFASICAALVATQTSVYFNSTMIPVFLGHAPAGASVRQFAHYAQSINRDSFSRFDHSALTNLRLYGSTTPPAYDLTRVTTICHLHYSSADRAVNPRDVELLATRLRNARLHKLDSPYFNHYDYVWASGVKEVLYDKIVTLMREAEASSV